MAEATKSLAVRLPVTVKDQLDALAQERKETVTALLLQALETAYGIKAAE